MSLCCGGKFHLNASSSLFCGGGETVQFLMCFGHPKILLRPGTSNLGNARLFTLKSTDDTAVIRCVATAGPENAM